MLLSNPDKNQNVHSNDNSFVGLMNLLLKGWFILAAVWLPISSIVVASCKSATEDNVIPYIPPAYYQCMEITTYEMAYSYWSPIISRQQAADKGSPIPGEAYRGKVFVIKNSLVTAYMLKEVNKGYIWLDMIKCIGLNSKDLLRLKVGDRVDIVGINKGPEAENYTEFSEGVLIFADCVVLPAGAVKLPAEGSTAGIPVY